MTRPFACSFCTESEELCLAVSGKLDKKHTMLKWKWCHNFGLLTSFQTCFNCGLCFEVDLDVFCSLCSLLFFVLFFTIGIYGSEHFNATKVYLYSKRALLRTVQFLKVLCGSKNGSYHLSEGWSYRFITSEAWNLGTFSSIFIIDVS